MNFPRALRLNSQISCVLRAPLPGCFPESKGGVIVKKTTVGQLYRFKFRAQRDLELSPQSPKFMRTYGVVIHCCFVLKFFIKAWLV